MVELLEGKAELVCNANIQSLDKSNKTLIYKKGDLEQKLNFDVCISALPADAFAKVFAETFPKAPSQLEKLLTLKFL